MVQKGKNFWERMRRIRQKRIESRAGKALIHEEMEMLEFIDGNKVPTMIQHCVLKVMKKVGGDEKEQFISAFNICSATFSKHGYTRPASMGMTGAGIKRNRRHQREKEASAKKARYNGLVRKLWASSIKRMKEDRAKGPASAKKQTNIAKRRKAQSKAKAQPAKPAAKVILKPNTNMGKRRAARQARKNQGRP